MHARLLLLVILLLISKIVCAEVCPPVTAIQKNQLAGWTLLDSDDNKVLSKQREAVFRKDVQSFAMAEWTSQPNQAGKIRCYYRDKNGSNLDAYITKDHYSLTQASKYWYEVSGAKECAAGADKCGFQSIVMPNSRFASGKTLHDHLEDLLQEYWR